MTAPRRRLSTEDRRRQLLDCAASLFAESGFDAVSIEDIAADAGVSVGLLYHYFPSKRELLIAVIRDATDGLFEQTAPDPGAPPVDRIRSGIDGHLSYVESHAKGYAAVMRPARDPDVQVLVDEVRDRFVERLVRSTTTADPPPRTLVLAFHGWMGYVDDVTLEWLRGGAGDREQLREFLVQSLIAIVGAAARSDPTIRFDV